METFNLKKMIVDEIKFDLDDKYFIVDSMEFANDILKAVEVDVENVEIREFLKKHSKGDVEIIDNLDDYSITSIGEYIVTKVIEAKQNLPHIAGLNEQEKN